MMTSCNKITLLTKMMMQVKQQVKQQTYSGNRIAWLHLKPTVLPHQAIPNENESVLQLTWTPCFVNI